MTRLRAPRAAIVLACIAGVVIGGPAGGAAQDTAPAAQTPLQETSGTGGAGDSQTTSAREPARPSGQPVAAPERLVTVLPRYPRGAEPGTAGTVTLQVTVDATGRPVGVQTRPEHDRAGLYSVNDVLTVAPKPGAIFQEAAVNAVMQWVYAPPAKAGITLLVQFVFLSQGRVRLAAHEVVEPAASSPVPAAERSGADATVPDAARVFRFQVGETR